VKDKFKIALSIRSQVSSFNCWRNQTICICTNFAQSLTFWRKQH